MGGKAWKRVSPTERLFWTLGELGLRPRHIVDIGGNLGNWTRAALAAFPQAKVTLFEPQRGLAGRHADLAEDERVVLRYMGVGDRDGTAVFTFHPRHDSATFVHAAGAEAARGMAQGEVAICRLDTAMAGSPFGPPEIVKIDAEGFDLKVLEGGARTMAEATVVLVEAAVANPVYPNTVVAVIREMDALGFQLFDITDLNRTQRRGVLWLIEAAFVRRDSAIARKAASSS